MFTSNINSADRIIRLVLGIVLLALVFIGPKTLWGLVGLILIITAFINFCPLYSVFKINTRKKLK